ncbi:MAG: NUDIX domain-containing protein [Candidatus Micrarchaeaceae archaeon]
MEHSKIAAIIVLKLESSASEPQVIYTHRRQDDDIAPGAWNIVLEHQEPYEANTRETALRGVKEEIGISGNDKDLFYIGSITDSFFVRDDEELSFFEIDLYMLPLHGEQHIKLSMEEATELSYMPLNQLYNLGKLIKAYGVDSTPWVNLTHPDKVILAEFHEKIIETARNIQIKGAFRSGESMQATEPKVRSR